MNASSENTSVAAQERSSLLRRYPFEALIAAIITGGLLVGVLTVILRSSGPSPADFPETKATTADSGRLDPAPVTGSGVRVASHVKAADPATPIVPHANAATPMKLTEAAAQLDAPNSASAELSTAPEADVRAEALRGIGANSTGSLPLLEDTLHVEPISRNRLLAINALRLLARNPALTPRVRSALQGALDDADENVATSARDALAELGP